METLPRGLAAWGTNLGPLHIKYFSNEGSCQHAPLAPRVRLNEAFVHKHIIACGGKRVV